ncbi:unnamed protein product [Acanthosepion pharaonis]|uniref:DUF7041 domain-containing protein n=1 Tax=Acanthosepion pharaonis TaxID=158019 RepID=A0A812D616_ACAPH|nr:unnamed protein product [Sepia pharaonis]
MSSLSLEDETTNITKKGITSIYTSTGISATLPEANGMQDLLQNHSQITTPFRYTETVCHNAEHNIYTTDPPTHSSPRRLSPDKYKLAKAEFQHMLDLGIIRPSSRPYSFPLHMVPKPDPEAWRPYGDFRKLNATTIPHLHDFAVGLQGATVFTKLDLVKVFHQIRVAKEDIHKTAITTPFAAAAAAQATFLCDRPPKDEQAYSAPPFVNADAVLLRVNIRGSTGPRIQLFHLSCRPEPKRSFDWHSPTTLVTPIFTIDQDGNKRVRTGLSHKRSDATRKPTYIKTTKNWFLQLEAIFSVRRITSQQTKFTNVVQVLTPSVVNELADILENVHEQEPYTRLKDAILKRTGRSDDDLLRELFTHVTRGDRTPSQLLRFMRTRLGKHSIADSILREIWMDKLPTTITQILALFAENTPLDHLADSAYRIAAKLDQGVCSERNPDDTLAKNEELEKAETDMQHQLHDIRILLSRRPRDPKPMANNWRRRIRSTNRDRLIDLELSWVFDSGARVRHASLFLRTIFPHSSELVLNYIQVSFVQDLRHRMAKLTYTPPQQQTTSSYLPQRLDICDFVFVRNDAVKKPLTPSYQGPFKVLKRSKKFVTIMGGKDKDTVSINRLKPAWLEETPSDTNLPTTTEDETTTPVIRTKSGRRVHFPEKNKDIFFS